MLDRGLLLTQLLHIKIVNTKNFGCIKDSSRQRKGTMRLLPMEVEDLIKSSRAVGTRGILLKGIDNKTVRRYGFYMVASCILCMLSSQ